MAPEPRDLMTQLARELELRIDAPALSREPAFAGPVPSRTNESLLRDLARVVRRRFWTILLTALAVLIPVGVLTALWPKTYASTLTLLVDAPRGEGGSPPLAVLDRVQRAASLQTEMELLASRRVVEPLVDSLDLHVTVETRRGEQPPRAVFGRFSAGRNAPVGVYEIGRRQDGSHAVSVPRDLIAAAVTGPGGGLRVSGLEVGELRARYTEVRVVVAPFAETVEAVRGGLDVTPTGQNADVLHLTCASSVPIRARAICQGVAENYLRMRAQMRRSEASATAGFLRTQVERLRTRLSAAEDSLQAFGRRTRSVDLEEQAAQGVRQVADLQAHRDLLEVERSALSELLTRAARSRSGTAHQELASFPTFLRSQTVTDLMSSLVELENRRSDLAVGRTAENRDVAALDRRIREIKGQLTSMSRTYERSLAAQVRNLDRTIGARGVALASIPTHRVEEARLKREVGLLGELYGLLETRLREAEVAEAVHLLPSVTIVDPASLPAQPSWPNVPLNLGLGLVLGLALGMAAALFREHGDMRLHGREEVAAQTALPILALIPRLPRTGALIPLEVRNPAARGLLPSGENGDGVYPLSSQGELALEAVRSLGADLTFMARQRGLAQLRVLAVTSASRGEGKTFTACNLALARASHGLRTLLIDADMRASGVSAFFGLRPSVGLRDVLSGGVEPADAWWPIELMNRSKLWVITAGQPTADSARLIESPRMEEVLRVASATFDLVLLDTPPLNILTDTATLASRADGVLLVVRGGFTDREALMLTLERLRRTGAVVLGTVVNDVTLPEKYTSYSARYQTT